MSDSRPFRILLVDDTKAHRMLIRRALRKLPWNCQLEEVESFGKAAALVDEWSTNSEKRPNLCLFDINLGDGSGLDLLTLLRKSPANAPCFVVSTSELESERSKALALGADAYLLKSGDLSDFTKNLAQEIERLFVQFSP